MVDDVQPSSLISMFPQQAVRFEICHDRRDRRSGKFFAYCVNFLRKEHPISCIICVLLGNLLTYFCKFTHTISCETAEILHLQFRF